MKNLQIETIIFDLDGTLVNTTKDLALAMNLTLKHYNCNTITEDRCIELVGDGIVKLVSRAFGESKYNDIEYSFESKFLDSAVELFLEIYQIHLFDNTLPYNGVEKVLQKLKNKKLAVISNKHYEFTLDILKHFQLDSYFEIILGGDSLKLKKPHPEPILHVMKKLNSLPTETIIIGDTDKDIRAGKAAKIYTCAATYGMRDVEELKPFQPDYYINNISELLEIIT